MKSISFLIVFLTLPFISMGQTERQRAIAEKLMEYYPKAIKGKDSVEYQRLFFNSFPDNFGDFVAVFGFWKNEKTQKTENGPLYDGHDEIYFFFSLKTIPEKEFYQKMISVAIGGRWNADAVTYLQNSLYSKVNANPYLTFDLLKKKPDSGIKSFWFFFYHSPSAPMRKIPGQLAKTKTYDTRVYKLMMEGYDEASKQSLHKTKGFYSVSHCKAERPRVLIKKTRVTGGRTSQLWGKE